MQVNNYVGVLKTKSGLTIEVLPKISDKDEQITQVKKLFFDMLRTVKDVNGKVFDMTNLDISHHHLSELFISMFLHEVSIIVKNGMKSGYVIHERNEPFLKGKLLMNKQIQYNTVNKARFYNRFDEYHLNIPENQILKATLLYLLKETTDYRNNRIIRELLNYFEQVSLSRHPEQLFKKVKTSRQYVYYNQALQWAEIFLLKKSFTSFRGSSLAFALLFPMEKVFESYIAHHLKKMLGSDTVQAQENRYYLFKDGKERGNYKLRPDIVVRRNNEGRDVIIIDTKWKRLDSTGPSQADLYQMYAYYTRYHHHQQNVKKVVVLYPYSPLFKERQYISRGHDMAEEAVVEVCYVDLLNPDWQGKLMKILE